MSSTRDDSDEQRLVSLSDHAAVTEILKDSVLDLWKVVNNLTRLRPAKRDRYRVAIFGSARAKPETFVYEEVKRVASAFAAMGCDIVTGGGPGLMQAANEGAQLGGAPLSLGIRVTLPFEQHANQTREGAGKGSFEVSSRDGVCDRHARRNSTGATGSADVAGAPHSTYIPSRP